MKFKLLFLCTLLFNVSSAQNDTITPAVKEVPQALAAAENPTIPDKTFEMFELDKQPSFPGGEAVLHRFLAENIVYPDSAKNNNKKGTVVATFVVNPDGKISNIQIIRDIGLGCGKEVIRVLSLMPAWIPGEAKGRKVKARFTLPVLFKLT